ncbi:TetR/AcrR family transcriptional regulator [Pseudomonas sp. NPDC089554]|uniref:TetR/AcrR family transcriptional regulator n=1 Tax=Pseudomonas sp. NPDC089554 TaxID=3390653 RepID=UPI003CFEF625
MTYAAILQSATQLLSRTGLDGFNTNAIAERAGTSIGTLYQYFPNKEAVMLELIHRQKRDMLANIYEAMRDASGRTLDEAVRLLIQGRVKHLRGDPPIAWVITQQEQSLPIPHVRADHLAQGSQVFMRGLSYWGPTVQDVDPLQLSRTIPALVRGVIEHWTDGSQRGLDVAEREAVDCVLGYLDRQQRR